MAVLAQEAPQVVAVPPRKVPGRAALVKRPSRAALKYSFATLDDWAKRRVSAAGAVIQCSAVGVVRRGGAVGSVRRGGATGGGNVV